MEKLKVFLVYSSYFNEGDGLAGGGVWNEPTMVGAFRDKKVARNWVRRQRRAWKFSWRTRFTYKTLLVT